MLCVKPFVQGKHVFSCGQCIPCRIRKRREWTHRIMLEAGQCEDNAFVTLTYSDEFLPNGGTLVPEHTQSWLKRFRKSVYPLRIRYYVVGEYGETSDRPHYHCAIFGYPSCYYGNTRFGGSGRACCPRCSVIKDSWGMGEVFLGSLEEKSAQYISGYVVKKMTRTDDRRLKGRWPEFARMSLRPGIGFSAMHEVASQLMVFNLDTTQGDVPVALRHGKKELPLGRYLRGNLRKMIGKDKNAPLGSLSKMEMEVRELRSKAFESNTPFSEALRKANEGGIAGVVARSKLRKKRGTL